ncbi:DUF5676 family membrane protein [Burkholderia ubonensis]|uniref:DUF5676 family membrane protein n=2 Tax=Burkholderia cepacia complex TaxID=87882 RepID=UPI000752ECC9|nr:DUF5676 family membrane protein [Burkholderia ubonensis]KVL66654.1 hypothetical protein WJ48_16060 [Burkholderia ubonensis]KVL68531.1 hypothetical protein WJ49_27150 [Burkholderia ubonensis]KVL96898.1 hypothetical protein WJ50_04675 [Burkholderia ubonensis]
MKPFKTGVTLSVTVLLFYALCTLVWAALPEPFMNFMQALFHGLDFRRLQTSAPLSWWSVVYPGLVLAAWLFVAGAFFAWLNNRLQGER